MFLFSCRLCYLGAGPGSPQTDQQAPGIIWSLRKGWLPGSQLPDAGVLGGSAFWEFGTLKEMNDVAGGKPNFKSDSNLTLTLLWL